MPYTRPFARIRQWIPAPAIVPGWQLIALGLAALPSFFIAFSVSIIPLYTSAVLLLDAAPAVPNVVVGGVVTAAVAVVGWLLNRAITNSDAGAKETKEAVHALTLLVTEMRLERKEDRLLVTYLKDRQDKLENENASLRTSVQAFDTFIAVQVAAAKKQTP